MISSKVLFALDARLEFKPEERALIDKYKLGKQFVYDSENRKKYADRAVLNAAASEASGTFRFAGRSLMASAMAALSLRVTIDSLASGQHIECQSLDELLGAEGAMREACANVRVYLDTAEQFDGREEVIAF
jgi:hypothetical protein